MTSDESFENLLNELTERERQVLQIRYKEGLTLKEAGVRFGVTGERIRQVEAKALKKIRQNKQLKRLIDYIEE